MKLYYDFHIHSCLSPCGDADMTPNNIVNFAKLLGYDAIALTDHNTALNCPAVAKVAEENGITFIPGMELCTSEEVHIICLFYTLEDALSFSDYVKSTMPPIKNKPAIFGEQLICDENDNVIGQEDILLVTASGISTERAVKTVSQHNGICYPAHIDRSSFSILSNLGVIDKYFGFKCAEIFDVMKADELKNKHPYLNELKILSDSDAHYLENMRLPEQTIDVAHTDVKAILDYLDSPLK